MNSFLEKLIITLLSLLPEDFLKNILNELLTYIEQAVKSSPNQYDDWIILPLIKKIRDEFNIPEIIN